MLIKINVPEGVQIVTFGDIHGHPKHFEKLLEKVQPNENTWLVSVGDLFDKGFGKDASFSILRKMQELSDNKCGFLVQGNHELKYVKHHKTCPELEWIRSQPTCIVFKFANETLLTILHGGVLPKYKWQDLSGTEVCYIRKVDSDGNHVPLIKKKVDGQEVIQFKHSGEIWGKLYDGRFGYIISGHDAQKDGAPKYYDFCCNIDTACYYTGKLTAQYFSEKGLGETLTIIEEARHSEKVKEDPFVIHS